MVTGSDLQIKLVKTYCLTSRCCHRERVFTQEGPLVQTQSEAYFVELPGKPMATPKERLERIVARCFACNGVSIDIA